MGAVGVKHIETQPVVLNPNGAEAALQLEAALIRTAPMLPLVTVTAPPTSTRSWHVAPRRQPFGLRFCCKSLGDRDVPHDMYKLNKWRCISELYFWRASVAASSSRAHT
jgi:hypothetical protein